jgi:hypothetical protein
MYHDGAHMFTNSILLEPLHCWWPLPQQDGLLVCQCWHLYHHGYPPVHPAYAGIGEATPSPETKVQSYCGISAGRFVSILMRHLGGRPRQNKNARLTCSLVAASRPYYASIPSILLGSPAIRRLTMSVRPRGRPSSSTLASSAEVFPLYGR